MAKTNGYFVSLAKKLGFDSKAAMAKSFGVPTDTLARSEHRGGHETKAKLILLDQLGLDVDDLVKMYNQTKNV